MQRWRSKRRKGPDLTDNKEIRKVNHPSLLAPSRSNAFSISSFLLTARIIDRRVSCTELQLVKRNIGADISTNACVSRCILFPRVYPRFGLQIMHLL